MKSITIAARNQFSPRQLPVLPFHQCRQMPRTRYFAFDCPDDLFENHAVESVLREFNALNFEQTRLLQQGEGGHLETH